MRGELNTYKAKRNFGATPEPKGRKGKAREAGLGFLIQRHAATRLHYDFRIEVDGVLRSRCRERDPRPLPDEKGRARLRTRPSCCSA